MGSRPSKRRGKQIFNHRRNDFRSKGGRIDFADPFNSADGGEVLETRSNGRRNSAADSPQQTPFDAVELHRRGSSVFILSRQFIRAAAFFCRTMTSRCIGVCGKSLWGYRGVDDAQALEYSCTRSEESTTDSAGRASHTAGAHGVVYRHRARAEIRQNPARSAR